jgi:hypothetical protein
MGDHSEIVTGRPAEEKQLINASRTAANKTLSAPESPFSLCNAPDRERAGGGVGLRMRSKLEYVVFRSVWETDFCVHLQSRYGSLKQLQLFWYTLYIMKGTGDCEFFA